MRDIEFRYIIENRKGEIRIVLATVEDLEDSTTVHDLIELEIGERIIERNLYTGLKDKNGIQIFRGDFIKDTSGISLVSWHKKNASFSLERDGWAYSHFFGEAVDAEDTEVIGNKFENPEIKAEFLLSPTQ